MMIKLSKASAIVKALLAITFPQYKGRTIKLVLTDEAPEACSDEWEGGSRTVAMLYALGSAGSVVNGATVTACPPGWIVVEWSRFMGRDAGITIRAQRRLDVEAEQVALDALLQHDTALAKEVIASRVPGQWGQFVSVVGARKGDPGVVTARDLAYAAVYARAGELFRAERAAVAP